MDNSLFGVRLRKYRDDRGISIASLAEKADISNSYVSRLEAGLSTPSFETLMKLAKALHITPNCLICEEMLQDTERLKEISYYKPESLSDKQVHVLKSIIDSIIRILKNDCPEFVGTRIVAARNAKRMASTKLSELTDLKGGYIRNIENGTDAPSISALEKISETLDLHVNYLICDNSRETELYVLNDMIANMDKALSPQDTEFVKLLYNYIIGGFAATDEGK